MNDKKINLLINVIFILFLVSLFTSRAIFIFSDNFFEDTKSYDFLRSSIPDSGDKITNNGINMIGAPTLYSIFRIIPITLDYILFLKVLDLFFFLFFLLILFLLVKEMTKDKFSALFCILAVSISPIFFLPPYTALKPEYLILGLLFSLFYALNKNSFLEKTNKNEQKPKLYLLMLCLIILSIFSTYAFIFILHILIYLVISYIEKFNEKSSFIEFSIFSFVLIVSSFFLFNLNAVQSLKSKLVFGTNPIQIHQKMLALFEPFNIFSMVGVVIIIGGIYAINYYFSNKTNNFSKKTIFLSCGIVSSLLLLLAKIGNPVFILMYCATLLCIIFSFLVKDSVDHANTFYRIKISKKTYWIIAYFLIILGGISINYSIFFTSNYQSNYINQNTFNLMNIVSESEIKDSLIIAPYYYGSLIGGVAKQNYILDESFYNTNNPKKHLEEIDTIYKNINNVKVHGVIDNYLIEYNLSEAYVFYDDQITKNYNITTARIENDSCFELLYRVNDAKLFKYGCFK